ncbi:hypothetical protein [uncultured Salinicola sp.]|uniref:hypothetical protein n=1 Tax=uncultured Salinicola sp. TaxID=1193542 RepID=UPI002622CD70|nr:hypothetical protein [uncultured Salinicola sp.]|tara:strand:+ start:4668 stop:4877 length:210 start_codon:yes stop_codon:yes gene_type:complete
MSSTTTGAAFAARLAAAGLETTDRTDENERTADALRRLAGKAKMARNNAAISAAAAEAKRDPNQINMFV